MKRIFLQLKQLLRNERGEITFFACFFVVGIVMLLSFLLLYASIRITCINIRNGAKMELNNLTASVRGISYPTAVKRIKWSLYRLFDLASAGTLWSAVFTLMIQNLLAGL